MFYTTEVEGNQITLRNQEAQHCSKVLRKAKGEAIYVIDGEGSRYHCHITDIQRQTVLLNIQSRSYQERDVALPHLAFGLIKNVTRLEWLIEKVTEIGVARITPLLCTRSERSSIKKERLEKVLISAVKQSLGYYLPVLDDPMTLRDYITSQDRSTAFIGSYGPSIPELSKVAGRHLSPVMLIGPEGDFSQDELHLATDSGYRRVNLGQSRLRAETAAMVACTILRH